jgi:hypothetical protein
VLLGYSQTTVLPIAQALSIYGRGGVTTAPGAAEANTARGWVNGVLRSAGLPELLSTTTDYDDLNKALAGIATNSQTAGRSDAALAATLAGNASTHIHEIVGADKLKANIAQIRAGAVANSQWDNMTQEQRAPYKYQYSNFLQDFNKTFDLRAGAYDMYTPAQAKTLLDDLNAHTPAYRKQFFDEVIAGKSEVSKPYRSPLLLLDEKGEKRANLPTMFAAAPVRNAVDKPIAAFGGRIRPDDQFTKILQVARFGNAAGHHVFAYAHMPEGIGGLEGATDSDAVDAVRRPIFDRLAVESMSDELRARIDHYLNESGLAGPRLVWGIDDHRLTDGRSLFGGITFCNCPLEQSAGGLRRSSWHHECIEQWVTGRILRNGPFVS